MLEKNILRKTFLQQRNSIKPEEIKVKSEHIVSKLELLPEFINAKNVHIYWSLEKGTAHTRVQHF